VKRAFIAFLALPCVVMAAPTVVRFEQHIGRQLPMDCPVVDETGRACKFGSFFDGKPVVLFFNYFRCPELCSLVASGAIDALRQLRPSIGRDYEVVSVSIDPSDTPDMARTQHEQDVGRYGRTGSGAGWHTLVGTPASIQALTSAAGFFYRFDERSRQYSHPSGLVLVSPRGVVSRYFLGIDFPTKDFDLALRRAGQNELGRPVFNLLFICFDGTSPQGRYGRIIWSVLWASVALTVASVFGGIGWMLWREHMYRAKPEGPA
jgi:protein SCO1/2